MELEELINDFLIENTGPATGCTEPIAVAYATSLAYNQLIKNNDSKTKNFDLSKLESIEIEVDRDVYKNAFSVCIPNTNGLKGMDVASALGIFSNPDQDLNLLNSLDEEKISKAYEVLEQNKINVKKVVDKKDKSSLDIKVKVHYENNFAEARIEKEHTNVTEIKVNGDFIYSRQKKNDVKKKLFDYSVLSIKNIIEIVDSISLDSSILNKVYLGIDMIKDIANQGLSKEQNFELNVGKGLQKIYGIEGSDVEKLLANITKNEVLDLVEIISAAAGDARMGGANYPIMSTAGSGNQGITALTPIYVVGEVYGISKKEQAKAALVSHMVTRYVTEYSGYLSALCGCAIKAGIGSAAGVAYMLSKNNKEKDVSNAINYVVSDITGIICDGAKAGCANKLSTASRQATRSALLALDQNIIPSDNGIVYSDANKTIKAIGEISKSMVTTDLSIIYLMQNKK